MSHIVKSEQDIIIISQLLERLRSKGYTNNIVEEILNTIIPNNTNLPINIIFGNSKTPAFFHEKEKKIEISSESLKNYIQKEISPIAKVIPKLERELFYNYILLALAHEVEHYYQCLIKNNYIDFPYKIVIDGYYNLTIIKIPKNTSYISSLIKINRFLHSYNGPYSLIERNANVEAYDLLLKIAKYENNTKILNILNNQLLYQVSIGYQGLYNGAMEKTYKKKGIISIYNSFDHNEIIPIEDRVRYGLPIDNKTKKKVLKKQFNIQI